MHAVEPLVFEQIFDHLPADKIFIGKKILQNRLQIATRIRIHETIDIG